MRTYAWRPVHVIVVGGLSQEAFRTGLDAGYLTAIEFLSGNGIVRKDCVAPFPSLTPTAIASIVTGMAPDLHGILGRAWFSRKDRTVHEFDPGGPSRSPAFGSLGDRLAGVGRRIFTAGVPRACGGSGTGVGLGDGQVADLTRSVIRDARPDLTISFLREMDARGHASGTGGTIPSLRRADREVGRILESYGSWENALTAARWIVTGDHGMSAVNGDLPGHILSAEDLSLPSGAIVVPNGRAAFIYLEADGAGDKPGIEAIAEALAGLRATDQVFWREAGWTRVRQRDLACSWRPGQGFLDVRGREWQVVGDFRALGLVLRAGQLVETEYSDPMRRVDDLLDAADAPDMVITARRGYEFAPGSGRASHGSLLAEDSEVPLVATGFGMVPHFPEARDVAKMALEALLPDGALAPSQAHGELARGTSGVHR